MGFWKVVIVQIKELAIQIKRAQAHIKLLRKYISESIQTNNPKIYLYKKLIQSDKFKITSLIEEEDNLLAIEYSEYLDINRRNNP